MEFLYCELTVLNNGPKKEEQGISPSSLDMLGLYQNREVSRTNFTCCGRTYCGGSLGVDDRRDVFEYTVGDICPPFWGML